MAVKSVVKLNKMRVKELKKAHIVALEKTGEQLKSNVRDSEKVPMKTGALKGEQFFCDYSKSNMGHVSLVHSTPYARLLYFHPEYNFNTQYSANAQAKWFKDYLKGGNKENYTQDVFNKLYKKEAGI